jgi:hypothetical protein
MDMDVHTKMIACRVVGARVSAKWKHNQDLFSREERRECKKIEKSAIDSIKYGRLKARPKVKSGVVMSAFLTHIFIILSACKIAHLMFNLATNMPTVHDY